MDKDLSDIFNRFKQMNYFSATRSVRTLLGFSVERIVCVCDGEIKGCEPSGYLSRLYHWELLVLTTCYNIPQEVKKLCASL